MKAQDLYKLGFKDDSSKKNGVFNYYLIKNENDEVFIQICINHIDPIPVLVTSQYDWGEMISNTTYLSIVNCKDIEALQGILATLKNLFIFNNN